MSKARIGIDGATLGSPSERKPPPGAVMTQWTIYRHPKDYPHGHVLRATYVMDGGTLSVDPVAWYAPDADTLRKMVPLGLIPFARAPQDDRAILETWL